MPAKDRWIGKKFGLITVVKLLTDVAKLSEYGYYNTDHLQYEVVCECGNASPLSLKSLRNRVRRDRYGCRPCRIKKREEVIERVRNKYSHPPYIHNI